MEFLFYYTGVLFWVIIALTILALSHEYLYYRSPNKVRFIYSHTFDTLVLPVYIFNSFFYDVDKCKRILSFLERSNRFQSKILARIIKHRLEKALK